jgi:prepilin-type N-terminal cleavage/methylation domain-containing protein
MAKLALLLELTRHQNKQKARREQHSLRDSAGYTLLELLIAMLLAGIIAAIAAPSWLTFVSQRRVNKANDVIFNALQEAQSEAKKRKTSYSVSFRTPSGKAPEFTIYPTQKPDGSIIDPTNPSDLNPGAWKSFAQELSSDSKKVALGTNLNGENSGATGSPTYPPPTSPPLPKITFDYMGTLPEAKFPNNPNNKALIVEVAVLGNSKQPILSTRRCVKIQTLLGSMQTGTGNACNP